MTTLHRHLNWSEGRTRQIVRHAVTNAHAEKADEILHLTEPGRDLAQNAVIGYAISQS